MSEKMTMLQAFYLFEHKLMPRYFFEDKAVLFRVLTDDKENVFKMFSDLLKDNDLSNPYTAEDFEVVFHVIDDKLLILQIKYPEPTETPLCYEQVMITNKEFTEMEFYCLEFHEDESHVPSICTWNVKGKDMMHGNCGCCTADEFFMKASEMYMNKYYGKKKKS